MICPHCNAENRDGAKFCDECGTRLVEPAEQPVSVSSDGEPERAESVEAADEDARQDDVPPLESPRDSASVGNVDSEDILFVDSPHADAFDPQAEEMPSDQQEAVEDRTLSSDKTGILESAVNAPASEASQTRRIDLSGFDEFALPGSYVPPQPSWRDGGTMRLPRIEEDSSESNQKSFRAPKAGKGRSKGVKVALGIILAVLLCAVCVAFATYQMELWGGKVIPDTVGLTQADATNTLESKGFSVRATQVKSDETEGIVLLMDPTGGSRLEEGGEVVIHVATSRSIPKIVGLQRSDAETAIAAEGLANVNWVTQRSDEAEGSILSVEPAEGERARANTAVTVTVAEPYVVPSVESMTQDEAFAAMEEAGYAPYFEYVYTEDVAEGTVLGSTPAEGERVPSGSEVGIQVAQSRSTELVNATYSLFGQGATVTIDGVSYTVNSCDAVSFQGSETTSYTITATPFTYFLGVYLPLSPRSVSGTIVWNADNTISSGSPAISVG